MPSFLKKLLLGKDLSNPYVNKYHVGHRATPESTRHVPAYAAQAMDPHPTSLTLSTRMPPRPVSPTYLEEARRLAGRNPVTGRALSVEQVAGHLERNDQMAQATYSGRGRQQPSTNRVQQRTVGRDAQHERHDVIVRDERRRRLEEESAAAERLRQREIGGYFAPERSVRGYYSG